MVAATNLRPSTTEEAEDTDKTAAELLEMARVWQQKKEAEEAPRARQSPSEGDGPKWKTDGVVKRAARFGRSFLESKRMMKGLKSIKEVLKIPKVKRPYVRKKKKEQEVVEQEVVENEYDSSDSG